MKKTQLRLWHPIIGIILLEVINVLNNNLLFPGPTWKIVNDLIHLAGNICCLILAYIIIRNIVRAVKGLIARRSSGEAEELERQREAERREVEMVRKSNDILLHLIQDEHREEGDR